MKSALRTGWLLLIFGCSPAVTPLSESTASGGNNGEPTDPVSSSSRIAVSDRVSYVLENAEQRHAEFPETFWIPPREQREALSKDELVKLLFQIEADGETQTERMWVLIQSRTESGYVGTLDNQPTCTDELKPGAEVRFKPRHVIDIYEVDVTD